LSFERKGRFRRKIALIGVVIIAVIVVGVALWQAFPRSPAVADWTLVLVGPYSDNMTRASFESGLNCQAANHGVTWTDSNNNVWFGMPLWYLIGWIDDKGDANRMEFNGTLAEQGYTVKVITGQEYSESFNSSTIARNDNIILADRLNGVPLPDTGQYWPLRLVGSGLSSDEMLGNVVEIQMIVPEN